MDITTDGFGYMLAFGGDQISYKYYYHYYYCYQQSLKSHESHVGFDINSYRISRICLMPGFMITINTNIYIVIILIILVCSVGW